MSFLEHLIALNYGNLEEVADKLRVIEMAVAASKREDSDRNRNHCVKPQDPAGDGNESDNDVD